MKTAISVPDDVFEQVEQKVNELGWSRSAFYATAAEQLLARLNTDALLANINAAVEQIGDTDESALIASAAGRRTVTDHAW